EKNGIPHIERVAPAAAIPGGEITIHGRGFVSGAQPRPVVRFGEAEASIALASENRLVARVPEGANGGVVRVATAGHESQPHPVHIGLQIADNLHPVGNPAVDLDGNIYVTFSGPRGQRVPVSLYKITANYSVKPFTTSLMNPSGLALDRMGNLFVSCRNDGTIHRITPDGRAEQWIEGMGVATGIAFDHNGNLYVGDRSGTVFKISRSREIFVFATLEPSIAAYHLAFHPNGDLYVSGPTTSSFDRIHRITQGGDVSVFFRGLGRPQGLALDRDGNLYVAASYAGRRGIVRITPQAQAEVVRKSIVGDNRDYLSAAFKEALERVELVIASGGLGPTEDDLTRETVADLLSRKLHLHQEILRYIEGRFRQLGREMPAVNVRQAMVPEGAEILENPRGSAPGLWLEDAGRFIALLPGPPRELKPMYQEQILPRLQRRGSSIRMFHRELRVAGMGESSVEQRINAIYTRYAEVKTTILAAPGEIQIHLRVWTDDAAHAQKTLDEIVQGFEIALVDRIFSQDGSSMEEEIGRAHV